MADLDKKANEVFGGKVVRKDLVRKIKVGANVPVFVLEYLLGKYCATDDQQAIEAGVRLVNDTLAKNYVRPDESTKAQSKVKEKGEHTFIDKVKVRLVASEDKYWAELVNFGHKYVHVPDKYIRKYDRLLEGGIWAQVDMQYLYDKEARGKKSPFWIKEIKPIQVATFSLNDYLEGRAKFSTEEWIDFLIRSIGLDPIETETLSEKRLKLILLARLIPLIEKNQNLIELGPRGTGKSYIYQEISPYCILMTGPTTVANLFYNMATNRMGLVGIWDVVAFDEVADLEKMPQEVITTLKTYCESGSFARGKELLSGDASIAFFGNTNQPIEVMAKSSHLFAPMPKTIRNDMAFLDRIHCYLPGWEIPKMHNEFFTEHYGFVVDYFAEALKELRKHNFTEMLDKYFSLGSHLNARDAKAVRKTVSGLTKLIHPDGNFTKDEMAEYLDFALECRRRVKEQLKKMGSFEYYRTSFSYLDNETMEERFVGVPEEGGKDLISTDPLSPGTVYAASCSSEGKVALYRIEITKASGTGKLKLPGGMNKALKDSINRAFAYIHSRKEEIGISPEVDTNDFNVEGIDLLNNHEDCETGVAFVIALFSVLKSAPVLPALVVLGDMSIQGNLKALNSIVEPMQIAKDNGAKRCLLPIENKRHFLEVSVDIVEAVDPIFYSDPQTAAFKALGLH